MHDALGQSANGVPQGSRIWSCGVTGKVGVGDVSRYGKAVGEPYANTSRTPFEDVDTVTIGVEFLPDSVSGCLDTASGIVV